MAKLLKWLLYINIKNRLMVVLLSVISVVISTILFVTLIYLQRKWLEFDIRFSSNFTTLFSYNIIHLITQDNQKNVKDLVETAYYNSIGIQYINLFNTEGNLVFSIPQTGVIFNDIFSSSNSIFTFAHYKLLFKIFTVQDSIVFSHNIIHSVRPLVYNDCIIGFLQIGLNIRPNILYTTQAIQNISALFFIFIWLIFTIGMFVNFLINKQFIIDLLIGLQTIALGNFNFQINTFVKGDFSDLVINFNEMSKRLQCYEKKNISQLMVEKAKLKALVSTITDGAVLLDTELRILFVNKIAVKVFQWFNKDIIGQTIFQYLPHYINEALLPILNKMIKSNYIDNKILQAQEVSIDLNYESLKTFRFLLSTVFNPIDQALNGIVIIIQDITRETQLNEAKNQFISNVSHELRTPLCNIGSFLETLIDYKHKLNIKQKDQFLAIAYAETQRLNRLVNDVLDLSRLESEYSYALKPIILSSTVSYIVQASQIISLNKQVQIVVEIDPLLDYVLAHENSLCQVLSNLISNALKFTHKGGKIIIRLYILNSISYTTEFSYKKAQKVRLEVIDEGIGIHKTFQNHIFDRFMRIENNIHIFEGTGLGLSIVKSIIDKYNSSIYVYSEVGIGTSFWFDLFIID